MLWYKEKLVKADEVIFDLADRGLLLGDGLFETLTAFNTIPFQLDAHLERMTHSAQRLGMVLDRALLQKAVFAVAGLDEAPCVIRLTASRGTGPRGLLPPDQATPLVFATRAPWHETMTFGQAKLATVSIRRNPTSPTSSMKTLAYLDPVLSLQEAKAKGADDALIVSTSGSIACTSMANVFILNQNSLVTPALDGSVLPGVIRRLILDVAPKLGLNVSERTCSVAELLEADLVMASNSVRFLTKIIAVDDRPLSTQSSELWRTLKNAIAESVSKQCEGFTLKH
jgi:branched-chain amino acid aminotransferase